MRPKQSLLQQFTTNFHFRRGMVVIDFVAAVFLWHLVEEYEQLEGMFWITLVSSFVWLGVFRYEFNTWKFWTWQDKPADYDRGG